MEGKIFILLGLLSLWCCNTSSAPSPTNIVDDDEERHRYSKEHLAKVLADLKDTSPEEMDIQRFKGIPHSSISHEFPAEKRFSGFVGSRGKKREFSADDLYQNNKRFSNMAFAGARGKRPTDADYDKRFSGFVGSRGRRRENGMGMFRSDSDRKNRINHAVYGVVAYLNGLKDRQEQESANGGAEKRRSGFHAMRGK